MEKSVPSPERHLPTPEPQVLDPIRFDCEACIHLRNYFRLGKTTPEDIETGAGCGRCKCRLVLRYFAVSFEMVDTSSIYLLNRLAMVMY